MKFEIKFTTARIDAVLSEGEIIGIVGRNNIF